MTKTLAKKVAGTKQQSLRVAGLFAGIGGFELGLQRAGHRTVVLCEICEDAGRVLKKRFPGVKVVKDVCRLKSLPRSVDLVTAGFPCQDLSQAGVTKGIAGRQSRLVWEVFRLIGKALPDYVIFENVPFMLRLQRGRAVAQIIRRLERLGYMWAYRIIDAEGFGVPQRRPRIFILASRKTDPRRIILADDAKPTSTQARDIYGFYWTEGNTGIGLAVGSVPALKNGSSFGIPSPPAISLSNGSIVTPHLCDAERLQGFPPHWTAPAVNGSTGKQRWRLIGNAVNVRVATWIGRRLRRPKEYAEFTDAKLKAGTWPTAAYNIGFGRFASDVGPYPVARRRLSIDRFLRFEPKPLSARATRGIRDRLKRSSLSARKILVEKLETHLRLLNE